jgi:hypothetical protein
MVIQLLIFFVVVLVIMFSINVPTSLVAIALLIPGALTTPAYSGKNRDL